MDELHELKPLPGVIDRLTVSYPIVAGFTADIIVPGDITPWAVERLPITAVGIVPLVEINDWWYMVLTHVIDDSRGHAWEFPAGGVDRTLDPSPEDSAVRELLEETGLHATTDQLKLNRVYAYKKRTGETAACLSYLMQLHDFVLPPDAVSDDQGRFFFDPFPDADRREVDRLAVEPYGLCRSKESLVRGSRYPALTGRTAAALGFWHLPPNQDPRAKNLLPALAWAWHKGRNVKHGPHVP